MVLVLQDTDVMRLVGSSSSWWMVERGPELTIRRYKVTKGLLDRFGEKRVIDSPITESGFAGLTVGAALAGLHPIVSFSIFCPARKV